MEIFKILGTIALDGMERFREDVEGASNKGKGLANTIGNGLATAAKIGTAAVTAASSAVGVLLKNSLDSYGEYEQLVGGAKLLFGDAYDFIAQKAATAHKDVQMSQSEYLQQANGLITGLKTAMNGDAQAAADLADKIITAEADIVAATGNSQEAVQNAFNGIMKSNFSMLDNLQLGITPTKEGFQEVIDKVNEWNKANGEATDYQIDNLADCQSALVDYIAMQGLSGYAQVEAAKSIQGSLSMVKASWKDLITGLADDEADMSTLIGNFVDSASTAAGKVAPRVTQILNGISSMITKMAPIISSAIPVIITQILPNMIQAGIQMIQSLLQGIQQNTAVLADGAISIITMLVETFTALLPEIIAIGLELLIALTLGIAESLPELVPVMIQAIGLIVETILGNLDLIIAAGVMLIVGLFQGLWNELVAEATYLGEWVQENIITPIENKFADFVALGSNVINKLWEGMKSAWQSIVNWFEGVWKSLFNRSVNVSADGEGGFSVTAGEYKTGLDYVPYNEFPALLHEGEAVLTKEEAKAWRAGRNSSNGGMVINQYISAVAQTPVQLASATAAYFEQARWAI